MQGNCEKLVFFRLGSWIWSFSLEKNPYMRLLPWLHRPLVLVLLLLLPTFACASSPPPGQTVHWVIQAHPRTSAVCNTFLLIHDENCSLCSFPLLILTSMFDARGHFLRWHFIFIYTTSNCKPNKYHIQSHRWVSLFFFFQFRPYPSSRSRSRGLDTVEVYYSRTSRVLWVRRKELREAMYLLPCPSFSHLQLLLLLSLIHLFT